MEDFTSKPIKEPVLDSQTQEQIAPLAKVSLRQRLGRFYSENRMYFWAIALGAVIIAVLGYFAFRRNVAAPAQEAKVFVTIDAPEIAPSGGEVVYKIKLDNQDSAKLVNLQLEMVYPEGAAYESSQPAEAANLSGTVFGVPDLLSGQNAVVIVKVRVQGSINDEKKLLARLHYRYSNFNSEFLKEAAFITKLVASDVTLSLDGPSTANNAGLVVYTLKYKNASDHDIQNSRIQFDYPASFTFAAADPPPDLGKNIWSLRLLPKGVEGQITLQGTFAQAHPGESQTITASLQILDNSGNFFTQAAADFITAISSLPLLVTQSLSDDTRDLVADPGDRLSFRLKYQNNATTVAKGVNIVASLDGSALDLSTLRAEGGQINNNTITWNASTVRNLENLNPSDGGALTYSVQVKNPPARDSSVNLKVLASLKIKSNEYETFFPGNDIAIKINTATSLQTALAYVSGSLPPQVGSSTVYKLTFSLRNTTNDLSNVSVSGFLPLDPGSFDASSVSAKESGNVSFDPSTGKVVWKAGNLPAHTGDFSPLRVMSFNLRLNPVVAQAGSEAVLFKNIVYSASDNFTGKDGQQNGENVTSSSIPDKNFSSGRVRP